MNSIGQIIARIQTQTEPNAPAAGTVSRTRRHGELVTPEQARDEDIPHIPCEDEERTECGFCGRTLWRRGVIINFNGLYRVTRWMDTFERCTCPEAVAYWAEIEAARAAQEALAAEKARHEAERKRIEKLIGESGMGARFRTRRFDAFEVCDANRRAFTIAKRYADTFEDRLKAGRGLFFSGPCGTGKTHLAASIANQLLEHGVPVMLMTMQRILDAIKGTYDDNSEIATCDLLEQLRTATLLIIDDLGKEQPTAWAQSEIYRIVNDRYEQMRPTIVTTNYDDDALAQRLCARRDADPITAEAIVSRLHEMTDAVVMAGRDRRVS